jgi:hypothetical protein
MTEFPATFLPYVVVFCLAVAFLATIAVGLCMGLALIFLQGTVSSLKKFNAAMDTAHAQFEQLNKSTREQLINQSRMAESWRRDRTKQLEEEDERQRHTPPSEYTQDWRRGQNTQA